MSPFRSIFTAVAICVVALAQQLCCCLVAPTVNSLLEADSANASAHCCHHECGDPDPASHDDAPDRLPDPHECECRLGRSLANVEAKVRPFADAQDDPGVPQADFPATQQIAALRSRPFALAARTGPSPGPLFGPAGPPANPFAQRVMLTV